MEHFEVNTKTPYALADIKAEKIIVRKVEAVSGNVEDIFHPIQVKTVFPNGSLEQNYFHPITYYSNKKRGAHTDLPIDVAINHCKYTQLIVSSKKEVKLRIYYDPIKTGVLIDTLIIHCSGDREGYTFTLNPQSLTEIRRNFPDAIPVRSVFVGYDVKSGFEAMYGRITKHIVPTLTDLTQTQLKEVGSIRFINPATKEELTF